MLPSSPIYTCACYLLLTPLWWVEFIFELILGWQNRLYAFFSLYSLFCCLFFIISSKQFYQIKKSRFICLLPNKARHHPHKLLTLTLHFSFLWITSILWPNHFLTAALPLWRFLTSPLHQILHSDHNLFWYSEDFILQAEMHINTKQTSIALNHTSYTFIWAYKQDQVLLYGLILTPSVNSIEKPLSFSYVI